MIIISSTPKIKYLPLQHLKDGFLAGSQITSEWKIKCMVYFTDIFSSLFLDISSPEHTMLDLEWEFGLEEVPRPVFLT